MERPYKLHEAFYSIISSTDDYPVDFEQAYNWIGYSTKQKAKEALNKNFIKNIDFISFNQKVKRNIGATVKEKILLSIDCFKSFCMMAGTEQGKIVRKYYLEIEKIYKQNKLLRNGSACEWGYTEALKLINNQNHEISIIKPKAKLYDLLMNTNDSISIGEFSKIIFDKTNLGPNELFKKLRELKILYLTSSGCNIPYQQYINHKPPYFKVIEKISNFGVYIQTRLTPEGQKWLINKLEIEGNKNGKYIRNI